MVAAWLGGDGRIFHATVETWTDMECPRCGAAIGVESGRDPGDLLACGECGDTVVAGDLYPFVAEGLGAMARTADLAIGESFPEGGGDPVDQLIAAIWSLAGSIGGADVVKKRAALEIAATRIRASLDASRTLQDGPGRTEPDDTVQIPVDVAQTALRWFAASGCRRASDMAAYDLLAGLLARDRVDGET